MSELLPNQQGTACQRERWGQIAELAGAVKLAADRMNKAVADFVAGCGGVDAAMVLSPEFGLICESTGGLVVLRPDNERAASFSADGGVVLDAVRRERRAVCGMVMEELARGKRRRKRAMVSSEGRA